RPEEGENETDNGTVDMNEEPIYRIRGLRLDTPAHEEPHHYRHERDREQRGGRHGEGLRPRERLEEPALLRLERKDGEERQRNYQERGEERRSHFLRRLDDQLPVRAR